MRLSFNITIFKKRFLCNILLLVLMIICCLNNRDPDYANYEMNYNAVGRGETENLLYTLEPLFRVLNLIFYKLGFSFYQFHFIFYLIIFLIFRKVVLDYSKKPLLVVLCFAIYPFIIFCVQMRNAMGIVIVMYGIRFLKDNSKKENIKFVLLVIIASMIHMSCIVYLPMLLVNNKNFYRYLKCFIIAEIILVYTILPGLMWTVYRITLNRRFMVYNTNLPMTVVFRHTLPITVLAGVLVYCLNDSYHNQQKGMLDFDEVLARCALVACSYIVLIKININFFRIIYFMFPLIITSITNFSLNRNKRLLKNDKYLLRGYSVALSIFYYVMLLSSLHEETFNNVTRAVLPWLN